MSKNRKQSGMNSFVSGIVILFATIVFIVFGSNNDALQETITLTIGLIFATLFVRFAPKKKRSGRIALIVSFVVFIVAFVLCVFLGRESVTFFGGLFAGLNFGNSWTEVIQSRIPKLPWIVNNTGFNTMQEAEVASREALKLLEDKKGARIIIENGDSRFEIAGSTEVGMVCHRNADAYDERTWAVLQDVEAPGFSDKWVEVPMGNIDASMPPRLLHNLQTVKTALSEFFKDPKTSTFGKEWDTGEEAFATRLSTN